MSASRPSFSIRAPLARPWALAAAGSLALAFAACNATGTGGSSAVQPTTGPASAPSAAPARAPDPEGFAVLPPVPSGQQEATFAGGCFWCMESVFEEIPGVTSVTSGYLGGHVDRPTYRQVSARTTGHAEAIRVTFDPKIITYDKLLWHFWRNVDPTTKERQFCDRGDEYRPEIFVHDDKQKAAALASREEVKKTKTFDGDIVVNVTKASKFWTAEVYHQDYYRKNPRRYWGYRLGCGRDARLRELWGPDAGHHPPKGI